MGEAFTAFADIPRWLAWREELRLTRSGETPGKPTKIPYAARTGRHASTTDPATWATREEAEQCAKNLLNGSAQRGGVGIVLGALDDGATYLCGVDLDSSLDESGALAAWAAGIVATLRTYTEISPSGNGVKAFFHAPAALVRPFLDRIGIAASGWGCRRSIPGLNGADHGPAVEVYTASRYFTVTGRTWPIDRPATRRIAMLDWPQLETLAALIPGGGRAAGNAGAPWNGNAADGGDNTTQDNSRSAKAWRAALGMGADSYEGMREGLRSHEDPEIRDWVREKGESYGERELRRIWERGVASIPTEAATEGWAPLPGLAGAPAPEPELLEIRWATPGRPKPPPREWLLGNSFGRKFVASLTGPGGVGKTSVRIAQMLALASGQPLTDEHVFQRCKVLWVCFEDDIDEMERRLQAAELYYATRTPEEGCRLDPDALADRMAYVSIGPRDGKLLLAKDGRIDPGPLARRVWTTVQQYGFDHVAFDPSVKTHNAVENDNTLMNLVAEKYVEFAHETGCSVDIVGHDRKGTLTAIPGDPDRSRGASAPVWAYRLNYTVTAMSSADAGRCGVTDEEERRSLIRYDSSKVNLCPAQRAIWFRLKEMALGNPSELYPNGDRMQVAVRWYPRDLFDDATADELVAELAAGRPDGQRYSSASGAKDLAAWRVVSEKYPNMEEAKCRRIIRQLIDEKRLFIVEYRNLVTRKEAKGLNDTPENLL